MKPTTDLEVRILNRLQGNGQTIGPLETFLHVPQSKILAVLIPLQKAGHVKRSAGGVWDLVRK
jgi:hypothetical protein